jgi:hypothetical protein
MELYSASTIKISNGQLIFRICPIDDEKDRRGHLPTPIRNTPPILNGPLEIEICLFLLCLDAPLNYQLAHILAANFADCLQKSANFATQHTN